MSDATALGDGPTAKVAPSPARRVPVGRVVVSVVVAAVLVALPFMFPAFRVEQFVGWMALAIAAARHSATVGEISEAL